MPYPKKLLNPDERIALDLHPHWWYFAEPAAVLAAWIGGEIALMALMDKSDTRRILGFIIVGAIVLSALWLVKRYLGWMTTNFVVTSDRLIFRQGVLAKSGIEIPLERVNNVNFSQSVFERLIGAGDLLIESGGEEGQQEFTDIRKPHSVQNLIITQAEAKIRSRTAGVSAPAPTDVASQLEKLEGMLQRGSLTQEEFEAQKAKLLGG